MLGNARNSAEILALMRLGSACRLEGSSCRKTYCAGIETFERVFDVAPHIPILILVAANTEAVAKLAVQRGAQDYLLTGRLDEYLLPKALRNMIERTVIADAPVRRKGTR
ncbi:MAG TPA: hypothetical protein VGI51_11380 [Steroidobacteraceae bacterium]|jgi:DNA-binding NarL/FixJ family response regulator